MPSSCPTPSSSRRSRRRRASPWWWSLPVGLVAVRVLDVAAVRARYGMRTELAALTEVARTLLRLVTESDRAIRIAREDFLVVLPGWDVDRVADLAGRITERMGRLEEQYPFVALGATIAATVTRRRPLPVGHLFAELDQAQPDHGAVRLLAG